MKNKENKNLKKITYNLRSIYILINSSHCLKSNLKKPYFYKEGHNFHEIK